jgi:hypothetical protein
MIKPAMTLTSKKAAAIASATVKLAIASATVPIKSTSAPTTR